MLEVCDPLCQCSDCEGCQMLFSQDVAIMLAVFGS